MHAMTYTCPEVDSGRRGERRRAGVACHRLGMKRSGDRHEPMEFGQGIEMPMVVRQMIIQLRTG